MLDQTEECRGATDIYLMPAYSHADGNKATTSANASMHTLCSAHNVYCEKKIDSRSFLE